MRIDYSVDNNDNFKSFQNTVLNIMCMTIFDEKIASKNLIKIEEEQTKQLIDYNNDIRRRRMDCAN